MQFVRQFLIHLALNRSVPALAICIALSGCISTDRPLLPTTSDIAPEPYLLAKVCDEASCQYGWMRKSAEPGKLVGGPYSGTRNIRQFTLHRLDAEHYIAQILQHASGVVYTQYNLVRVRNNQIRVYSVDLEKLNLRYLEELTARGMVIETSSEIGRRVGLRNWKVTNREGLLQVFTDISKLPEPSLSSLGRNMVLTKVTVPEMSRQVVETASRWSRLDLEDGTPPSFQFSAGASGARGCPSVLPPKVFCRPVQGAPVDIHPQLPREVIHFTKDKCVHCQATKKYVAVWQLGSQDAAYYKSYVDDFTEPLAVTYDLERVPAFVVNRKYVISMETSDKALTEYTMSLVSTLLKE